jgi:PKD repeat protein
MDDPYTLSGASASYYSSLVWSHTGLGTLSNPTTINPTYNPAPGELGSIFFTLKAYSNSPCIDSVIDQMELYIHPLPTGIISGQGIYCEGDSVQLTLTLTGTAPWTATITNGISNTTLTGIQVSPYTFNISPPAGTNNYTLIALHDAYCPAPPANMSGVAVILVNPAPVIDFIDNGACAEDTTYFTVSGDYILATSYWHWTFGDGTFWTCNSPGCGPAAHVFPAPGTYLVTLFVQDTNGCTYTVSHEVNVRPHPVAFFSFSTPDCLDAPVYFTDLCTNPQGEGYLQEWEWDFGDGSPIETYTFPNTPNTSHIYTAPGVYPVTLKVTNSVGCRDFKCDSYKYANCRLYLQ